MSVDALMYLLRCVTATAAAAAAAAFCQ